VQHGGDSCVRLGFGIFKLVPSLKGESRENRSVVVM